MTLGSTQPLTEMSTRCISWGKGGRCVRLTLPPSCAVVTKSGNLSFLEPSGPLFYLYLYLLSLSTHPLRTYLSNTSFYTYINPWLQWQWLRVTFPSLWRHTVWLDLAKFRETLLPLFYIYHLDGESRFFLNVGKLLQDYTWSHVKRR
jgi:hypothetical protein